MRRRQIFFGGHPVSITRQSCQDIFTLDNAVGSPYLVCEKSDGVRYLLVVAKVKRGDCLR
jgi:mRNA guanylyltransferase